jgi:hypothetical protein
MSRMSFGVAAVSKTQYPAHAEQWVDGSLIVTPSVTFLRDEEGFVVRVPQSRVAQLAALRQQSSSGLLDTMRRSSALGMSSGIDSPRRVSARAPGTAAPHAAAVPAPSYFGPTAKPYGGGCVIDTCACLIFLVVPVAVRDQSLRPLLWSSQYCHTRQVILLMLNDLLYPIQVRRIFVIMVSIMC